MASGRRNVSSNKETRPKGSKEERKRSSRVHFPLTTPHTRGGPFLCPPGVRREGASDQGTEPLQARPEVRAQSYRSEPADRRADTRGPPLHNRTRRLSDRSPYHFP